MEDWFTLQEEKLKIASLIVASLVLFVAIYRWVLQKWRADVSLRKYAYFHSLPSRTVNSVEKLVIEVPVRQRITLILQSSNKVDEVLFDDDVDVGDLRLNLNMINRSAGEYQLVMKTLDQTMVKGITWSGRN